MTSSNCYFVDGELNAYFAAETRVCFRYYHGNTGDLRAVTDSILVTNSLSSSLNGVSAH